MNWEETLQLKHALEQKAKVNAMVFQYEPKREAAAAFGKPLDYYFKFSYEEWSEISKELVKKRDKVEKECIKLGIGEKTRWCDFPHYRKEMGLDRLNF